MSGSTGVPTYRIDGPPDAPLLLLGPSLGTTADLWEPQLPALRARFRVVRYEHPGHGESTTTPLEGIADLGQGVLAIMDHLGADRASLAGLSLGGMVSMWVAAHAPERVGRLVLCCTSPHLPPPEAWRDRAALVRAQGTGPLLSLLAGRWFAVGDDIDPGLLELTGRMLATVDAEGYARCCEAIATMDQRPDLARITAPTLVIGGAVDPVCPPAMVLDLQAAIPGAGLTLIPGASHLANLDQPDRFTAAMIEHLSGGAVERGLAVRRAVLGDAHVDRALARTTPFTQPFQDLITRIAWGEVWTRPGLDRRTRSCITLAMLVALGRFDELAIHVRGARNNGLSADEIGEVLLQTAIYCGAPAANSAFAIAAQVLAEDDSRL
jgi:3-oxoadipate enol-lactonase/4-carboxymuconolactone decarboxylase